MSLIIRLLYMYILGSNSDFFQKHVYSCITIHNVQFYRIFAHFASERAEQKKRPFPVAFIGSSYRPAHLVGILQLGVPLHLVGAAHSAAEEVSPEL